MKRPSIEKLAQSLAAVGVAALAIIATAQEFRVEGGQSSRSGLPTSLGGSPTNWNNAGRGFLRWWDPVRSVRATLDNDESSTTGNTSIVLGTFVPVLSGFSPIAFNYTFNGPPTPYYRFSATALGTNPDNPTLGATAAYQWQFVNLDPNTEYELYVNLPAGPTDTNSDPNVSTPLFPQKYWVYRVSGTTADENQVIEYDSNAGGRVRLGNNGQTTSRTYRPTGTIISVTLYNTTPLAPSGLPLDPQANPGNQLVYADSCEIVSLANQASAPILATPVVGRLQNQPPGGGLVQLPWRVIGARNESSTIGELGRQYEIGAVTSYTYNGAVANSLQPKRFNQVWSWPARRPADDSAGELARYAQAKRDFVLGPDPNTPATNRSEQRVKQDNLSAGSSATPGFTLQNSGANNIGPNYLTTPSVTAAATEQALFTSNLPEGRYFVQVWLPGDGSLARGTQVQVLQGNAVVDTATLDQSFGNAGWRTLEFQPEEGYVNSEAAPLKVAITNRTNRLDDAGRDVYADAVRFVRKADLRVTSTPVFADTRVTVGGVPVQRDVVVVAMENGRLYCMDAHGDPQTGNPPQVYWVYPSETATDPNATPAFDGKDGIAEVPTGFDTSSAMVVNVGGSDTLVIAGRNGRVYSLDMAGRGDQTTSRRWTFPDDYNPSTPDLPMTAPLRPLVASVALSDVGGIQRVIVGTQEGRVYALDPAGNPATRTTSVAWQYPLANATPLGPILATPTCSFDKVFVTTTTAQNSNDGLVVAINAGDGTVSWQQTGDANGDFVSFRRASALAVPDSWLIDPPVGSTFTNPGAARVPVNSDALYVVDQAGKFAALNPADGSVFWSVDGETTGAAAGPRFVYLRAYDNNRNIVGPVSTVLVPGLSGTLIGFEAMGFLNRSNTHVIWGYSLDGSEQRASIATGGFEAGQSWFYTGDSSGFMYAFNSNDDNNINPITPGDPPADQIIEPNNPADELNDILDQNKIILLSPAGYEQLREAADFGNLDRATLDAIVTGEEIDRRHFDFGETMYVLVYDLPILSGQFANYYLEFELSGDQRATQRRQIPVRPLNDNTSAICVTTIPLMTQGAAGVSPGPGYLNVRAIAPGQRGVASSQVHLKRGPGFTVNDPDYYIANPISISIRYSDPSGPFKSVGIEGTDGRFPLPADTSTNEYRRFFTNGNTITDQLQTVPPEPDGLLGPTPTSKGDLLTHGNAGFQQVFVFDRSLNWVLMGRGLANVRVGPRDVAWVVDTGNPTGGVYYPLTANTGVTYPGFEDYPTLVPNRSLDYPDVRRDNISVSASLFGTVENPLFTSGVTLVSPTIQQAEQDLYRTKAGYEAQLGRSLNASRFDTTLLIPRYQPPSLRGYYGSQIVYVDSQQGLSPGESGEVYRTFGLGMNVAVAKEVKFDTPTVDLGSLPAGGGYNGGATGGPIDPWNSSTLYGPWNNRYDDLFQPFAVLNDGNVNVLNLRLAKFFTEGNQTRPVEMFMPGQHELAWLDAAYHMHSSIDPRYSPGVRTNFDLLGRNIMQKPRPGDLTATRFNINPRSRANAGLRTLGGYLFDTAAVPPGDPKVGVTAPIGAPSGAYVRQIFAFDNESTASDPSADNPSLDSVEAFSDPGLTLRFNVSEGRLTNAPSRDGAPMVENVVSGNEDFAFSNVQPTAMRDGLGNLFVAWASNRVDTNDQPAWIPKTRGENDLTAPDPWRIYIGSLQSVLGSIPGLSQSPVQDLNGWSASTADRWFRHGVVIDPPLSVFDYNGGAGETIDPRSVRFGSPVFPNSGFFNLMDPPNPNGRPFTPGGQRYMAFVGEANKRDQAGNVTTLSQLFVVPVTFGGDGSVTASPADVLAAPIDTTGRKGRPSLVQGSNGRFTAYVTSASGGLPQILFASYQGGGNWRTGSLNLGSAFENAGSPSVVMRRFRNDDQNARIDLTFTAKVRGRRNSEVYMARIAGETSGAPRGRSPFLYSPLRTDELTLDPDTGIYWSPGMLWRNEQRSFDNLDVRQLQANGTLVSILDKNTESYDPTTDTLRYNTVLGGQAILDTQNGSVRFTGAILRRDARLFLSAEPSIVRVSVAGGANYRSATSAFDDRFIGVKVFPNDPQRNLVGDLSYWGTEAGGRPNVDAPLRFDRTILAYTRTSADGSAATRPFFQSLRFGVQLPFPIRLNPDGSVVNFQVTNWGTAQERVFQLDPATGRVFFTSDLEDRGIQIRYDGVDSGGNPRNTITVDATVKMIPEFIEQALPMDSVGSETGVSIALDPLNDTFNAQNLDRRRPGLLWFFWSSGRNGASDIYFQTLAPRFTPRAPTK
ncbi:MAG: PQQ-binding-like beta-propeller repeat protein [Fimbriimonadaceae bacterium]|nr:PQQ-binding-like beta-propeller repeat protein [Fimbriimonadaceae bacterium]QYK55861.1 MAG: PQQ-binding-like beta-propeller repeat protein [Fimbriimonadaceae bacterium]